MLVITDIILLLYETFFTLSPQYAQDIIYFDLALCILLFLDFTYCFFKSDNKKSYLKENWLTLIACIPFDFFLLRIFRFARFIRIIRLFRITTLLTLFKKEFSSIRNFLNSTKLDSLFVLLIAIIIFSSVFLYFVDSGIPDLFSSFWYVMATITTVGCELNPETVLGCLISIFLTIVGISVFTIVLGNIYSFYETKFYTGKNKPLEDKIDNLENKIITLTDLIEKQNQEIQHLKNNPPHNDDS